MDDRHARRRRRRGDPRRRPLDGFRARDTASFVRLVGSTLAALPPDLAARADSLDIVVLDVPPGDDDPVPLAAVIADTPGARPRLEIYRRPLEARAHARAELAMILTDVIEEELEDL